MYSPHLEKLKVRTLTYQATSLMPIDRLGESESLMASEANAKMNCNMLDSISKYFVMTYVHVTGAKCVNTFL